jgi:hypothetical protein
MPRFGWRLSNTCSHPNIVQIFGAASSGSVHATLYHDGVCLTWGVVSDLRFTFEVELVPLRHYVNSYLNLHFEKKYFYACCVRVCSKPSIEPHLSKAYGLLCRNLFPIVEAPDARQAASDHVYSTFQRHLVSLSPGYPTSLTVGQGLG